MLWPFSSLFLPKSCDVIVWAWYSATIKVEKEIMWLEPWTGFYMNFQPCHSIRLQRGGCCGLGTKHCMPLAFRQTLDTQMPWSTAVNKATYTSCKCTHFEDASCPSCSCFFSVKLLITVWLRLVRIFDHVSPRSPIVQMFVPVHGHFLVGLWALFEHPECVRCFLRLAWTSMFSC